MEKSNLKRSGENNSARDVLLAGTVSRITFHNPDTGFGVLKIEPEQVDSLNSSATSITLVGVFPVELSSGTNIVARGYWMEHPKFGRQFRASSLTEKQPTTISAIEKYLASGAVKGCGPALAERIVKAFGEDTLRIFDENPEKLRRISGIGPKKYEEIRASWEAKKNLREVLLFFQNHEISLNLAQRIFKQYGNRSIEVVSKNPYLLTRDVWGIGFLTADKIALALGLLPDSPQRMIAALGYVTRKSTEDGHCYIPKTILLTRTSSLVQVEEQALAEHLPRAALEGELLIEGDRIYLPMIHAAEERIAVVLAKKIKQSQLKDGDLTNTNLTPISSELVERRCTQKIQAKRQGTGHERPQMISLSEEQQQAIRFSAASPLLVITGGPGCGKTTVLRALAGLYKAAGMIVKLAAPTGRAAQRMAEVCSMEASTIHRLLKFDPMKGSFAHDDEHPLPLDVLIVDESSMIDVMLGAALLRALPANARFVVVGDADQLPSVGPGLFLADLLNIQQIPRVHLSKLFRRADESAITFIAHQIHAAQIPHIPEPDGKVKSDAYFLPIADTTSGAELIERLVVEQIPKRFGFSGKDITVLTPMNQGELGIVALNQRLQNRIVPKRPGLPCVGVGSMEFRLGDRVCQRVNNYSLGDTGVFNGDQGEVIGIDAAGKRLFLRLWDGREVAYTGDILSQLDLAYALTIHRSQGSEVPVVVLALHDSHNILLERQLLYTAVTRAKQLLIIVGTKKALVLATKRNRSRQRYTALPEKTIALLEQS